MTQIEGDSHSDQKAKVSEMQCREWTEIKKKRGFLVCLLEVPQPCSRLLLLFVVEGGNLERDEKPRCQRCNVESGRR